LPRTLRIRALSPSRQYATLRADCTPRTPSIPGSAGSCSHTSRPLSGSNASTSPTPFDA